VNRDYWTLVPETEVLRQRREQFNLSRFYAIAHIEYYRNFNFKRHF
jgi:hypothetical protein